MIIFSNNFQIAIGRINMKTIILASTSPRRKELLSKTVFKFKAVASDYQEDMNLKFASPQFPEKLRRDVENARGNPAVTAASKSDFYLTTLKNVIY